MHVPLLVLVASGPRTRTNPRQPLVIAVLDCGLTVHSPKTRMTPTTPASASDSPAAPRREVQGPPCLVPQQGATRISGSPVILLAAAAVLAEHQGGKKTANHNDESQTQPLHCASAPQQPCCPVPSMCCSSCCALTEQQQVQVTAPALTAAQLLSACGLAAAWRTPACTAQQSAHMAASSAIATDTPRPVCCDTQRAATGQQNSPSTHAAVLQKGCCCLCHSRFVGAHVQSTQIA